MAISVRTKEGNAHPLGSIPMGTQICCVEMRPGDGAYYARAAGTHCSILRKYDDRVVIVLPNKHEIALDQRCMAVVGKSA